MKIKTIKFKKSGIIDTEKDREVKGLIIAVALFAASMIIGAGVFRNESSFTAEFSEIFSNFILARSNESAPELFFNSLSLNLFFIVIANFVGMSCIGFPVAVSLPVIKGFGYGFVAGYLLSKYSMSGFGYYLLTVLPGGILANAALLIICNDACFLSADILAVVLAKKQVDSNIIVNYIKRVLFLIMLTVGASIIDCLLAKAFGYLFIF